MSSNTMKCRVFSLIIAFILFSVSSEALCQASGATSVVEAVPATYPPFAIVLRATGKVTVKVEITPDGRVSSADALTGPESLRKPAITAAARWLFNESKSNKKMRTVELQFVFELLPQGATSEELLPTFLPPFTVKVRDGLGRVEPLNSSAFRFRQGWHGSTRGTTSLLGLDHSSKGQLVPDVKGCVFTEGQLVANVKSGL